VEGTRATLSGSPYNPIIVVAGGGVVCPPPHLCIKTSAVQKPTTLGSVSIPSMTLTTVPSIQNTFRAPFSYVMPVFYYNSVLTYSTLQTIGLESRRSNAPLQGSIAGTIAPFNTILYGGGHIPPLSPFLRGMFVMSPLWDIITVHIFMMTGLAKWML